MVDAEQSVYVLTHDRLLPKIETTAVIRGARGAPFIRHQDNTEGRNAGRTEMCFNVRFGYPKQPRRGCFGVTRRMDASAERFGERLRLVVSLRVNDRTKRRT